MKLFVIFFFTLFYYGKTFSVYRFNNLPINFDKKYHKSIINNFNYKIKKYIGNKLKNYELREKSENNDCKLINVLLKLGFNNKEVKENNNSFIMILPFILCLFIIYKLIQ